VKIRAADSGSMTALLTEVARHRDLHLQRLDLYQMMEKQDFPAPDQLSGPALHQYLILRAGIRVTEGAAEWCQEVLDALSPERHSPA
jgi:hypothetical protein